MAGEFPAESGETQAPEWDAEAEGEKFAADWYSLSGRPHGVSWEEWQSNPEYEAERLRVEKIQGVRQLGTNRNDVGTENEDEDGQASE